MRETGKGMPETAMVSIGMKCSFLPTLWRADSAIGKARKKGPERASTPAKSFPRMQATVEPSRSIRHPNRSQDNEKAFHLVIFAVNGSVARPRPATPPLSPSCVASYG
ncbi:hypothetical protein AA0522_1250 [Gluconacetobacter liquefaciens NRIC 0522]|nr:hypothetical protein AA0522_1250 [Gluconacetobacter liquefaciens NRIC 0522]